MVADSAHQIRILHIVSGDLWAGAEAMTLELLRLQAQDTNLNIHAALLNEGALSERLRAFGVHVTLIPENHNNSLKILSTLGKLASSFEPDIIHTHRQKENVLGALLARQRGCHSVRTVHGWTEFPNLGWRLDKRLFALLDRYSGRHWQQAVVAVSNELERKLQGIYASDRLSVIENGIDVRETRRAAAAGQSRCDPHVVNIGIVGRLVPVKAHWRFIEAASKLLDDPDRQYVFHIVGDGPLRDNLAALIEKRGLSSYFKLHGFLQYPLPLVAGLQALVICSHHEGLPMNALEAAALGVPIISTPLPSVARIIDTGARGIVSSDNSPDSIAEAIASLASRQDSGGDVDPDTWPYSSAVMARKYRDLYDRVLQAGKASR